MVNISKLDFSGQHLYVGLDVHELTPSVYTIYVRLSGRIPARDGQKGSCHEETEQIEYRVQAPSSRRITESSRDSSPSQPDT